MIYLDDFKCGYCNISNNKRIISNSYTSCTITIQLPREYGILVGGVNKAELSGDRNWELNLYYNLYK